MEEMEYSEAEEEGLAGHVLAAYPDAAAAPAPSSGGLISGAALLGRLPSRQAESHAYMAVQDLHELDEAAAPAPAVMAGGYGSSSPYARGSVQPPPPWLATHQAGLVRSPAQQPVAWAGSSASFDGRPERRWQAPGTAPPPPPHPTTPPAAAGGGVLPFLHDSPLAQHKLAGPAASVLHPGQHGRAAQQELEHWMDVAAAHLPIPQQEPQREAAAGVGQPAAGAPGAAQQPGSVPDMHALLRAILTPATDQPAH